ncbi:MAG: GrpB family protein [Pseudomonadota bacterium]
MTRTKRPPEPHDPAWADAFVAAHETVASILGEDAVGIHHVGSTAIPGILAKPVIDILIEATSLEALDRKHAAFGRAGFIGKGEKGIEGRRYFMKDNDEGVRSHHIHAFGKGSHHIERHLAFRDYLIAHPDVARAYSHVKKRILADWRGIDDYIARKASFVIEIERAALEWYRSVSRAEEEQD